MQTGTTVTGRLHPLTEDIARKWWSAFCYSPDHVNNEGVSQHGSIMPVSLAL